MSTITEYKCPNCGGAVEFNIDAQTMKCPYCDSEFSVEEMEAESKARQKMPQDSFSWDAQSSDWGDEQDGMKIYICESCGGEVICDETTSATKCPYCDNNITIKGSLEGVYRPDLVIPFKLTKNDAKAKYHEFISGKRFLPKNFKDENHIDEIKGLYVPEWLFDCGVQANVIFDATTVRRWSDSSYDYTETSHYNVYRAGNLAFSGIPVDGSSKMADDLMESLEPFDLSEAVDFKAAYLAGYLSDKYDVGFEESLPRANERVKASAIEAMKSTVDAGYTTVTEKSSGMTTYDNKTRYALYPIWLLNTTYNGEKYMFAMNGQTGKMAGNLPIDKKKFFSFSALLFGGLTAAIYIIAHFFFGF